MPLFQPTTQSHAAVAFAYLVVYVALDWVSYLHPITRLGITPWNPQTGLSFALVLLFGARFIPWMVIALPVADFFVRDLPLPFSSQILVSAVAGVGYGGAALLLLSPGVRFDPTLSGRRDLLLLMAISIVSIAAVAIGQVLVLAAYGLVKSEDLVTTVTQAFVGDLIGVIVFTPFILIALTRRQHPIPSWEMGAAAFCIFAALWIVFGFPGSVRFQLFYVLFLPIVWIAVRFGSEGVSLGLVITQIGLIIAIQASGYGATDMVTYQTLMIVLALTGLAVGAVASEQQRIQNQLRRHQEALNRAFRLGTMGEFAAAVAHEINQPLTAIGNYARLAKRAAEQTPPDGGGAARASTDAIEHVERAGAVVRRLRDFIRLGRVETSPVPVSTLVGDALAVFRPELERHSIVCETQISRDLAPVRANALQIEQVLLNLLRNASEALAHAGRYDGRIVVGAAARGPDVVEVDVNDNGPGFDADLLSQPIVAFATTKSDGLGLGLSLSRSIVEAHGGTFRIENTARGARVTFTLPSATAGDNRP
jgi:signal transduction histidine kinase